MNNRAIVNPRVINALNKQQFQLANNPPPGVIFYQNEDGDVLDIQADVIGPVGTPFHGGIFRCKLVVDGEFPQKPPKGYFLTKIFHPNVSASGDICVNTLKKDWDPKKWSLSHIFEVVKCLLIVPFPESALNEDASRLFMEDYDQFFKHAKLLTDVHAKPNPMQKQQIQQMEEKEKLKSTAQTQQQTVTAQTSTNQPQIKPQTFSNTSNNTQQNVITNIQQIQVQKLQHQTSSGNDDSPSKDEENKNDLSYQSSHQIQQLNKYHQQAIQLNQNSNHTSTLAVGSMQNSGSSNNSASLLEDQSNSNNQGISQQQPQEKSLKSDLILTNYQIVTENYLQGASKTNNNNNTVLSSVTNSFQPQQIQTETSKYQQINSMVRVQQSHPVVVTMRSGSSHAKKRNIAADNKKKWMRRI